MNSQAPYSTTQKTDRPFTVSSCCMASCVGAIVLLLFLMWIGFLFGDENNTKFEVKEVSAPVYEEEPRF